MRDIESPKATRPEDVENPNDLEITIEKKLERISELNIIIQEANSELERLKDEIKDEIKDDTERLNIIRDKMISKGKKELPIAQIIEFVKSFEEITRVSDSNETTEKGGPIVIFYIEKDSFCKLIFHPFDNTLVLQFPNPQKQVPDSFSKLAELIAKKINSEFSLSNDKRVYSWTGIEPTDISK